MGLTVRRIGVAAASAQIVVEYDEHVASKSTNGSVNSRRHQVVSLTQEAMGMVRGACHGKLGRGVRRECSCAGRRTPGTEARRGG
jgi:hypothetical protein